MPGIFGIISSNPDQRWETELRAMQAAMTSEAFYSSGTYCARGDLGCYAGWTCHQGSFYDCLPIFNREKSIVLLFAGDDFSRRDNLAFLEGRGRGPITRDAGYLASLYEELGDSFPERINGLFQGLLIDLRKGRALLFNDRFGMRRLYFHQGREAFYFASEAKAILRVNPGLRGIDERGLAEYLSCGCVLGWRTLFKGIQVMPGASLWSFRVGEGPERTSYFDPGEWEALPETDQESFYQELKRTLREILPRYLEVEGGVGISLTGGLDTRMILANADTPPRRYPCYTFSGIYRESRDVKVARKVAAACGQEFYTIEVARDFLGKFPELAEKTVYVSDGNLDVGGAPEIYINRQAREIAPIRVTGNYGGELLRSLRALKCTRPRNRFWNPGFDPHLEEAEVTLAGLEILNPRTRTLFVENPWLQCNRYLIENSQLQISNPFLDLDLAGLLYRAPEPSLRGKALSRRLINEGNGKLARILTDRGTGIGTPSTLTLVSRVFHEAFFKSEYYWNYGMPQWLAGIDFLLYPFHPEKFFLGRHKFYHFRLWYRDELAWYVREILLDRKSLSRPYLDRGVVEKMVAGHVGRYRNYTTEITQLLTLELMHRTILER